MASDRDGGAEEAPGARSGTAAGAWLRRWWRAALAELLATALLVLLGCMSLLPGPGGHPQPLAHAALAFGFLVVANVQIFGGVSGAHMNPAVTLTALLAGECAPPVAALYVLAQCLGAALGFGALLAVGPPLPPDEAAGCTVPTRVTPLQALAVEALLTGVLALLCCSLWRPPPSAAPPPKHDPALPVKFGLTVAGLVYAGGLLSGASLNPARSFGPALWHNQWTAHWVYWAGPLGGAALAALLYRWVLAPPARAAALRHAHDELPLRKCDA